MNPHIVAIACAIAISACAPVHQNQSSQVAETSNTAIIPEWCDSLPRPGYASLTPIEVDSDWFQAWRVGEGVIALYEPKQWQEVISYLIVGEKRALLFDTGMGIARISDVVSQLTDLPVTALNSHTHMDHIGGNAEFEANMAMDTDYTRTRSAGLGNAQVREELAPEALCAPLPAGVTQDNYVTHRWPITQVVTDGTIIDLGGRQLEIIAVPGHTPDAIALFDPAAGYLWTGDSFYEGPIWLFAPETDLESYAKSVERMAALAPRLTRLFPAHNTPVANPNRLIELRDAFSAIQRGTLTGTPGENGMIRYEAGAFSLLLRAR